MNGFRIKKVTLLDIRDLQKISKETFLEAYSSNNSEQNMLEYMEQGFSLERLREELANPNSLFYFAIIENKIIGYLKINFGQAQTEIKDEKSLEIQRIYVSKAFQGKKIGKALYQQAVKTGKQKKLNYLWLGVWEENPKAIQFYKNLGFKAFDTHIFKLGDEVQTDILMKHEVSV